MAGGPYGLTAVLFNLENGVFSINIPALNEDNNYAPYPPAFLLPPQPGTTASSTETRLYLRSILTLQYYLYGQTCYSAKRNSTCTSADAAANCLPSLALLQQFYVQSAELMLCLCACRVDVRL